MAPALLFALALFAADPGLDTSGSAGATALPGEPQTDYQLVAWCYGALSAHMSLHDEAMPEVERIERTFETHPGAANEELAFYAQQQKEGKKQLTLFRKAMTAAEKASIHPIQQEGATAIAQGRAIWAGADYADKRRLAQEWMSWALPDRCASTAQSLEQKSSVLGAALSYNAGDEQPAATPADEGSADETAAPAAEAGSADETAAPPAETSSAEPATPAEEPMAPSPEEAAPAEAPAAEAPPTETPVADAPATEAAPVADAPPTIDDLANAPAPADDGDEAQNPPAP
jgi:hypothetical protein